MSSSGVAAEVLSPAISMNGALSELDVLVVDCQTTGASPAHGSVLELGWGVVRAGSSEVDDLCAYWVELPPGRRVPTQIRRLTGYDEARCAALALSPQDVWQRLMNTIAGRTAMPTAIHFARFELAFLRDWCERFHGAAAFPLDAVCVHAIATRLFPELPRHTIRALAGFLGHSLELQRSSLGHVQATAFIWSKLSRELAERGVLTWQDLVDWLKAPAKVNLRAVKRRAPLPSSAYRGLPDQPGVYQLLRSNGDVLYVGKAASLRRRVANHFTGRGSTPLSLEMRTQVGEIRVTTTATPLEAALLETDSIKSLRPPYNTQLLGHDRPLYYSSTGFDAAAPEPDGVFTVGPVPARSALFPLSALLDLCTLEVSGARERARAVGTAEQWAPDAATFGAGFALFGQRYQFAASPAASPRKAVLGVARRVLQAVTRGNASADELAQDAESEAESATLWDPDRVLRHLERSIAQAYQLLRRSRWLLLLHDSVVLYREPGGACYRRLTVIDGQVADAGDVAERTPLIAPARRNRVSLQRSFDRAKYDRLRVLTTELKRVRRDGGEVVIGIGRTIRLSGTRLDAALEVV